MNHYVLMQFLITTTRECCQKEVHNNYVSSVVPHIVLHLSCGIPNIYSMQILAVGCGNRLTNSLVLSLLPMLRIRIVKLILNSLVNVDLQILRRLLHAVHANATRLLIPTVTNRIRERIMELAGHCHRHEEEATSKLILWPHAYGKRGRGCSA